MINDSIIVGVTKIANVYCKKKVPDFTVTESQTRIILEAYLKLLQKMIEESDGSHRKTNQSP